MASETIYLPDEAATAALGARLAATLGAGDVVLLAGGLGAGKTTLARALVRTLMGDGLLEVPSPSFALVQPYRRAGLTILHADLYRLTDPRDIEELGLFDEADAIVVIEWPERAPGLFTSGTLHIRIEIPADGIGRTAEVGR